MRYLLLLILATPAFSCPKPVITGPISDKEIEVLKAGCKRIYGPKSCLVRVESKPEIQHFNAVCRRED